MTPLLLAALAAGVVVSQCGMVGFVGLLVPHVARLLVGHDVRPAFITSILLGAGVMLFADQVARLARENSQLKRLVADLTLEVKKTEELLG